MKLLRYSLTPRSSLSSSLQSDTLAGHLLCFVRERDGEEALKSLISQFLEGDPPFILSSAFPKGKLPFPALPPLPRANFRALIKDKAEIFGEKEYSKKALFKALQKLKKFRKQGYLSLDDWKEQKDGVDIPRLFLKFAQEEKLEGGEKVKRVESPHNVIDRQLGRVADEGGLFFTEETFFREGFSFDLYAKVRSDFLDTFENLLSYMADTGFGRDRGVGKGAFAIERDETFDPAVVENPKGNYLLNLSIFATDEMASWKGYYSLMTKYGRVWNGFGEQNPFKKPFLAFREGSVFEKREVNYGACILKNIHSNQAIIQCTLPLMIPFYWEAS